MGATGGTTTNNGVTNTSSNTNNNTEGTTTSNTSNLGVGYTYGKTIAEQIAIKNCIITMKGSLSKNEVSLLQNGVPNQNLNDNIDLELIIKTVNNITVPYLKFKGLFNEETNAPQMDDTKIKITKDYYTFPVKLKSDITAKLGYTYVYRDVIKGENTVIESDDKVCYYTLANRTITSKSFILLKKDEINVPIYHIIISKDGYVPPDAKTLYLNYYGEHIELLFSTLISSNDLINWLRLVGKEQIKNFTLETGEVLEGKMSYKPFQKDSSDSLRPVLMNAILR